MNEHMKKCAGCTKRKSLAHFGKDTSKKDRLNKYCRRCCSPNKDAFDLNQKRKKMAVRGYKRCGECEKWKKFDQFGTGHGKESYGLRWNCKKCHIKSQKLYAASHGDQIRAYHKKWEQENSEYINGQRRKNYQKNHDREIKKSRLYRKQNRKRINAYFGEYLRRRAGTVPLGMGRETKTCPACKQTKLLGGFRLNRLGYDGLDSVCIPCKRQYCREYARKHKKERAAYYQRDKKANPLKYLERSRINRAKHRGKINALTHRRRARLKGDGGIFTEAQWLKLVKYYAPTGKCLCCGKRKKLTRDHVIPIQKGGHNVIGNIEPLCILCNVIKHDKIKDYRKDKGKFARSII